MGISVGVLFMGALLPGIMLAGMYAIYVVLVALVGLRSASALPPAERQHDADLSRGGPFILIQLLGLTLICIFPRLVTHLVK